MTPRAKAPPNLMPLTPSMAYPLDEFYRRHGRPLPPIEQVEGEAVPEPYRSLLVHERDMTSTLESFYEDRIHLRLLSREEKGDDYFREVLLVLDQSGKPIEFGAILIHLARFSEETRRRILEEHFPLGRILNEAGIEYVSRPKAYLRLASDTLINRLLGLTGARILYGRRNTLFDAQSRPLAEIVEILPAET